MTHPETDETGELISLHAAGDLTSVMQEHTAAAIAAVTPEDLGDHSRIVMVPDGYKTEVFDLRAHEDRPRRITCREIFTTVTSVHDYLHRFDLSAARTFVAPVDSRTLTNDASLVTNTVIDEHEEGNPQNREHRAELAVRPTTAAQRWGQALFASRLTQEQLLELVTDGIGEIAEPDGSELRTLIADLHASRTTSARSVVSTVGETSIELAENVQLRAGAGKKVTVPDTVRVVFAPFRWFEFTVDAHVRLKPRVSGETVTFELTSPDLDDALYRVVEQIVDELAEGLPEPPLWT